MVRRVSDLDGAPADGLGTFSGLLTSHPMAVARNARVGARHEHSTGARGANSRATLATVVVTGSTSQRTLLNASVAITAINKEPCDQRAPRTTVDVLQWYRASS